MSYLTHEVSGPTLSPFGDFGSPVSNYRIDDSTLSPLPDSHILLHPNDCRLIEVLDLVRGGGLRLHVWTERATLKEWLVFPSNPSIPHVSRHVATNLAFRSIQGVALVAGAR